MAEIQTNTQAGALSQKFVEFVMMQAQNAALFLGQIPNPQTGESEINLEFARMFIDQLAMIQEKTRGNLSEEETQVLKNTLASLQMAFVEASRMETGARPTEPPPSAPAAEPEKAPAAETPAPATTPEGEGESRKKFTKSYGA